MRSTELTRDQLERIEREVKKQWRYYELLWKRAQANDMPPSDPFVEHLCGAGEHIRNFMQMIERLKNAKPQPYRPLVDPGKKSGLAWRELPWAEQQRLMMEEVRRGAGKPGA